MNLSILKRYVVNVFNQGGIIWCCFVMMDYEHNTYAILENSRLQVCKTGNHVFWLNWQVKLNAVNMVEYKLCSHSGISLPGIIPFLNVASEWSKRARYKYVNSIDKIWYIFWVLCSEIHVEGYSGTSLLRYEGKLYAAWFHHVSTGCEWVRKKTLDHL